MTAYFEHKENFYTRSGDIYVIHDYRGYPCRIKISETDSGEGMHYSTVVMSGIGGATYFKYATMPTKIVEYLNKQDWVKNFKRNGKPEDIRYTLRKANVKWETIQNEPQD